jgi:bacteriocin biosynthesis cyclodehydratase domain-containing protein
MPSEELLVFRGGATRSGGAPLVVEPSGGRRSSALELEGHHAALAGAVLDRAAQPVGRDDLLSSIERRGDGAGAVPRKVIDLLVEHGILERVVRASDRLDVRGEGALGSALRSCLARSAWPAALGKVTIGVLGALGTTAWRERRRELGSLPEPLLTVSFERAGAWIGPFLNLPGAPCPACLTAWRIAVTGEMCTAEAVAQSPRTAALLSEQVLLRAEQWATGQHPADEILYVADADISKHTLLAQPGCPHCARPATTAMDSASKEALVSRFREDWDRTNTSEPSEDQKAAFLDPLLGPLFIDEYGAPGLFRDLPVVLGSIRHLQAVHGGFRRCEQFSVTFGSGMTESRRRLVAYAEGVERFALSVDSPDIESRRQSELGPLAFPPAETARFAPEPCADGGARAYDDEAVDWSWVYEWTADAARLLIHDAIGFRRDLPPSAFRLIVDPFSSGTAAHHSLALAVHRALLELIERDAFLLTWYLRLPLREVDVGSSSDREVRDVYSYLTERGIELRLYDMRVDFDIPSVLICARATRNCGQWRAGGRLISASTATTWDGAIRHSLMEVLGHYSVFALIAPEGDAAVDPATGETRAWWPGFGEYFHPRADDPFSFLGNQPPKPLTRVAEQDGVASSLAWLRGEFLDRGLPVFIRYVAPDAIRRSGLLTIRACVPGLVRLVATRDLVNLGEPRIDRIRARWGAHEPLNPMTHPIA